MEIRIEIKILIPDKKTEVAPVQQEEKPINTEWESEKEEAKEAAANMEQEESGQNVPEHERSVPEMSEEAAAQEEITIEHPGRTKRKRQMIDRKEVIDLMQQGITIKEIAKKIGASEGGLHNFIKRNRLKEEIGRKKSEPVSCTKVHKKCIYYSGQTKTCDYMVMTKDRRGCDPEACTRFRMV